MNQQAGDKITITFEPPVALTSFRLVSGNAEHPSDRFFNTTVEVSGALVIIMIIMVMPSDLLISTIISSILLLLLFQNHFRWCRRLLESRSSTLWAALTSLVLQRAPSPPPLALSTNFASASTLPAPTGQSSVRSSWNGHREISDLSISYFSTQHLRDRDQSSEELSSRGKISMEGKISFIPVSRILKWLLPQFETIDLGMIFVTNTAWQQQDGWCSSRQSSKATLPLSILHWLSQNLSSVLSGVKMSHCFFSVDVYFSRGQKWYLKTTRTSKSNPESGLLMKKLYFEILLTLQALNIWASGSLLSFW